MQQIFHLYIEHPRPDCWNCYVPGLPGLSISSSDRDTLFQVIPEVVQSHLEGLLEYGCGIPDYLSMEGCVEVMGGVPAEWVTVEAAIGITLH